MPGSNQPAFDAFLLLSFGGPEAEADVLPFLETVLRGRNVPRARLLAVAEHYRGFGGRSPLNRDNRRLLAALDADFRAHGLALPLYWGNRNWYPWLGDTVRRMRADGARRALVLSTSAFGSYSGCRQYLEDLERARAAAGAGAPELRKLRLFFNHPRFIAAAAGAIRAAMRQGERQLTHLLFTAHSIPLAMARSSPYEAQLREACALVLEALLENGIAIESWSQAWQSRSGPPAQPWLEPALDAELRRLAREFPGAQVVVAPIGFLSDHMEVAYDLDIEARQLAESLGLGWTRAAAIAEQPEFISLARELVEEQLEPSRPRRALGQLAAPEDACAPECCVVQASPR